MFQTTNQYRVGKKTWNHQPTWGVNTAINLPRVVESNITKCKKHHQTWEYTDITVQTKKGT